jgi:hypothetical protein
MGKRKRKLSFKRLPAQRQLLFSPEGEYFDLKTLFDKLNAEYFSNALRGYTITWGRKRKHPPKEYFVFGTIQEEDKMIRFQPGSSNTSSTMKCSTRWCLRRLTITGGEEFTRVNSTGENVNFTAIIVPDAGKTKISTDSFFSVQSRSVRILGVSPISANA